MRLKQRISAVRTWLLAWRPLRVALHFGAGRGPILAAGLAYQALFAVFAALWATFSIAGSVVSGDLPLQTSILRVIRRAVPGLIDDGSGSGAIDPEVLLSATIYNISGIVAIGVLVFIALGWLASARDSVRHLFGLPSAPDNFVLRKLLDLALGLGLGALLVIAAALSFAGTSATGFVLDAVGIGADSMAGAVSGRIVTLMVMVGVYAVALGGLYRVLAGVRIPWRFLKQGVALGAFGLGALTALGTALLGGATSNPLIASFAVVAGLLVYFNLASQVILIAASWMAVGAADARVAVEVEVAGPQ